MWGGTEDTGYELYVQNSLGRQDSPSYSTESPTSVEVAEFLDRLSDWQLARRGYAVRNWDDTLLPFKENSLMRRASACNLSLPIPGDSSCQNRSGKARCTNHVPASSSFIGRSCRFDTPRRKLSAHFSRQSYREASNVVPEHVRRIAVHRHVFVGRLWQVQLARLSVLYI